MRAAIQQLFSELEGKFGETVVSHTLGYITCGLNGLTEVELEDALSCDDETLDEVYQYHNPPVEGIIRFPPVVWVRIKQVKLFCGNEFVLTFHQFQVSGH